MQLYEERGKRGRSRSRKRGEWRGTRARGEGEKQEKEGAQLEVSAGKQNSGILYKIVLEWEIFKERSNRAD